MSEATARHGSWPDRWRSSPVLRTARGERRHWRWPARAHVIALDVARPLEYPGYGLGTGADLDLAQEACRRLVSNA